MVNTNEDENGQEKTTSQSVEHGLRRNLHSFPYAGNLPPIYDQNAQNVVSHRKESRVRQQNGNGGTMRNANEDGASVGGSSDYGISSSTENSPPNSPSIQRSRDFSFSSLLNREYRPLIERMKKMIDNNETFFSMEFFPPKTANGVANLLSR